MYFLRAGTALAFLLASIEVFAQPLTFARADHTSYEGARAVVTADFDRNGLPDLAHANTGRNSVAILLNRPGWGFDDALEVAVGKGPFAMAVGDFNRDAIADLAVANADDDSISLLTGRGDGMFVRRDIAAKGNPRGVALADVTRDGIADLVYTSYALNGLTVLANDGTGAFRYQSSFVGFAPHPQGVVAADFNRDGHVDLAVAYESPGALGLFYMANGTLTNVTPVGPAHTLNVLAAADLNGDGWTDIVAGATWRDRAAVYLNSSSGFSYTRSYATGSAPGHVALIDVNHDGATDIVTANRGSDTVTVFPGNKTTAGAFLAAVHVAAGNGSRALAAADFNADGRLDLATGNQYAAGVTLLSNTTAFVRAAFSFRRQSLGAPYQYGPGEDVSPGDFDRDGTMDVAILNRTFDGIAVLLTGKPEVVVPAGTHMHRLAAGDFNGDGNLDLVARLEPDSGGATLRTFINDGRGAFAATGAGIAEWTWGQFIVADVNRDGRDDILAGRYDPYAREHVLDVLGGTVDGSLVRLSRNVTDADVASFAAADVNRDGKPDVVTLPGTKLWLGDGAGGLTHARSFEMPMAIEVELADMNRDGYLDLVLAEVYHVYVAPGTADGFGPARGFALEIPGPLGDYGIAIGDMDMDGNLDVVTKGANLLRGNGDGTLAPADRFDYHGMDVKIADFNRDGLPDLIVEVNDSRAEILVNERNDVNHEPDVRIPDRTFTYDEVRDECGGVYAEGRDPDSHFVRWEIRDGSGAVVSNEAGILACARPYGTYRYTWKAWDGRGAVVTGVFTVTFTPTKEIVLHVWINGDGIMGNWTPAYDSTAAGGMKAYDPNLGAPKVTAPLANPGSYDLPPLIRHA